MQPNISETKSKNIYTERIEITLASKVVSLIKREFFVVVTYEKLCCIELKPFLEKIKFELMKSDKRN